VEGPLLATDGTGPSAVGTGLLLAQGGGLPFQQRLQGAFGEAGRGRPGDLLHGVEIDIESGAGLAEGAAGDDLAPLAGALAEFVELLRRDATTGHDASCLGVNAKPGRGLVPDGLRNQTSQDKAVHELASH
jgi:hypothetical protein